MSLESYCGTQENQAVLCEKVALIGVGLLGGSLGLALKKLRLAREVVGLVRRQASIPECLRLGVVDSATLSPAKAVHGADLIVLCTPVSRILPLIRRIQPHLQIGCTVTDVGSVKARIVSEVEELVHSSGASYVGSHPMAGSETSGVASARADLFNEAICVVTPSSRSEESAIRKVEALWKSLNCRVLEMPAKLHDALVSRSSHLPQMVAVALVNAVLGRSPKTKQQLLCAGGFRDTTRIASSSPEMWSDIALHNRENISAALDDFSRCLDALKRAVKRGRRDDLLKYFRHAKQLRDGWMRGRTNSKPTR